MSFMIFPPEINSSLMYSGAGSGPLMAAASAWDELAADLESTAASYQAVLAQLTGTSWLGPTSARMAAATAPYVDWLAGTAGQAAQTSAQARFAAAAYEGAFASTVPPAVIAANRALLAALVATNFLGQNTPAIAATEAHYMEMWFQDGLTMDTYATVSQQAVVLPQQTPAPTPSDGGTSANAAAAAQSTANSASSTGTNLATALQNLFPSLSSNSTSSNGLSSAVSTVMSDLGVPASAQSAVNAAVAPVATSTTGSLLPVQAVYYLTMFASMPAKMLMSMSNSMGASQAMQAGQQAMLADVTKMLDSKMKALIGEYLRPDAGVRVSHQCSAGVSGQVGWAVGSERLGPSGARDGPRGADTAGQQRRSAERVGGDAQQSIHPSTHGCPQWARNGHAGGQDGVRES